MADAAIIKFPDDGKEWRDVPGYVGIYALSSDGDVMRVCPGVGRAKMGAILRPGKNKKGYRAVLLSRDGLSVTHHLHVLVCTVFHGKKPTPKHQAAHRDDDKGNNSAANLYWATPLENSKDRRRNGRILAGSQIGRSILKETDVIRMFEMHGKGMSCAEIAKQFGVASHTASRIIAGTRWGHMGLARAAKAGKLIG